jgi:uncharacterized protein YbjT (DUF2867 family)
MRRRSAAIAGAGGLVGGFCLEALLAEDAYSRITALVRRPVEVAHSKLIQRIVNFDRMLPPGDLAEGVAFCALGTTIRKAGGQEAFRSVDFDYAVNFADWAKQAGASRFVLVSSVDAASRSGNFYLRVKGELEDRINGMGFDAVHIMRPSFLMGARAERRLGERLGIAAFRAIRFALIGGLSRYRPVEACAVGRAMVRAGLQDAVGSHVWHWKEIVDAGGL